MNSLSFVVLALMAMTVFAQDDPYKCNPNISYPSKKKTFYYDFTSLYHDISGVDTLMKRFDSNVMYINPCGVCSSSCITPDTSACLRTADWDYLSAGILKTQKITASNWKQAEMGKSAMITYSDGDSQKCAGNKKRSTTIHIICEPTASAAYFMDDYIAKDCKYTFYLYSATGCGTQVPYRGGASGGEAFATAVLIIFFVGLFLYFVIGFCLNKFVWHKEGSFVELLPNYIFWSSLPSLIADGCKFIAHGFKKGDYVTV